MKKLLNNIKMTKYDIKLRRHSLTQGQIERHKDFKSLAKKTYIERKSYAWIKLLAAVLAVVAVTCMMIFGIYRANTKKVIQENPDMEIFEEFKTE